MTEREKVYEIISNAMKETVTTARKCLERKIDADRVEYKIEKILKLYTDQIASIVNESLGEERICSCQVVALDCGDCECGAEDYNQAIADIKAKWSTNKE